VSQQQHETLPREFRCVLDAGFEPVLSQQRQGTVNVEPFRFDGGVDVPRQSGDPTRDGSHTPNDHGRACEVVEDLLQCEQRRSEGVCGPGVCHRTNGRLKRAKRSRTTASSRRSMGSSGGGQP